MEVYMKRFFVRHAKSSALIITLSLHGVLLIIAVGFVAFQVLIPPEPRFKGVKVDHIHPNVPLILKPFQTSSKNPPRPVIKPQPIHITSVKTTSVTIPPVAMIGVPMIGRTEPDETGLAFTFDTNVNFFDSEANGEKVCFVVHFGPATIGKNPYSRMTGYTIRKRLEEIVYALPDYVLFNVACYWAGDTCAMSPHMMLANVENKQKMLDWMEPVNPLEGNYDHCFAWQKSGSRVEAARREWPKRVEDLPSYSPKWIYPYGVPDSIEEKYLGKETGFLHWGRGVAWSILTQKPDTIFVLTTNYIDGWGNGNNGAPEKMVAGYKKMIRDIYGPDKNRWPTLNVVVLSHAGRDSAKAHEVLNSQFGPLVKAFRGSGAVIDEISKFMNADERKLLGKYASEYGE